MIHSRVHRALVRHRAALVVALCVALLYGSHHIFSSFFAARAGLAYYPVTEAANYDEGADYAPRARAAYRGDVVVGDVALAEYAHSPAFLPILNPLVLAFLGRLTGSFSNGLIASDFIFPPLIFLFVYVLAFELTRRRLLALVFASIFIVFPKIGLIPSPSAFPFFTSERELYFSRFEYPSVTFPFFALALYLVLRALRRRERATLVGGGIAVGSLFYTYFYDWVYVASALGLLSLYYAACKDWVHLRVLVCIGAIASVVSVGYWINLYAWHSLPSFQDIVSRLGVEVGRSFRFAVVWPTYVRAFGLSFAAWFLYGRRVHGAEKITGIFLVVLLLPIIFLLNVQVITNTVPQPDHWYRTQFLVWALLLFLLAVRMGQQFVHRVSFRVRNFIALFVVVLTFWCGFSLSYAESKKDFGLYNIVPAYARAYEWLLSHTPMNSVVGSLSGVTNGELLLHTANKVFLPNGILTVAPTAEIWNRALLLARSFGLSADAFSRFVEQNNFYLFVLFYHSKISGSYFQKSALSLPAEVRAEKTREYKTLSTHRVIIRNMPYRLDYILVGPRERELMSATSSISTPHVVLIYDSDNVKIYTPQSL